MPVKVLKNFKGINEYVDFAELSPEYAQQCQNLDPDQTLGRLVRRKGYTKKYTDTFTNIISAYEAKMETSGEVILLLNDNGTFKYFKDGTLIGTLTTPTGSTVSTGFTNNYFSWKDSIRVTTGSGDTNHILWFGYTKRDTADNDGLFGNALDDNGTYRLLRAQLIEQNGAFSRINSITSDGSDYYYVTIKGSRYIEKRENGTYKLLDRFLALPELKDYTVDDVFVFYANDGYVYMAITGTSGGAWDGFFKVNPVGWVVEAQQVVANGRAVYADNGWVYGVSDTTLFQLNKSDLSVNASDATSFQGKSVYGNDYSGTSTVIYVINDSSGTDTVERRAVSSLGTVTHSYNTLTAANHLVYGAGGVVAVSDTGAGHVKELSLADLTLSATNTNVRSPAAFLSGGALISSYVVSNDDGVLQDFDSYTVYKPDFIQIVTQSLAGSGSLDAGTYYYKYAVEDVDGQIFTASDAIQIYTTGSENVVLRVICNNDQVAYYYRIKNIRIYRAYSSDEDPEVPTTNYKLNKVISINSTDWTYDSDRAFYYFDYTDNTAEATHSSVSFLEDSGVGEKVAPFYVNGKYMTWLDNQIHLANVNSNNTDYKNIIVRGAVNQPDNIALYDIYNYQEDGGDEIKGITSVYGRTVVFKEKRVGIFYNGIKEQERFPGISSDRGYYKHNDSIFYLSKKGIYILDGNSHERINDPIVTTYGSISDYTDGSLFFFDDRDRLIVSFPGEEAFVYSLKYGTWTIYTNHSFKGYFKNDSGQYIGYSATLFYLLFQTGDDDGTRITIKYESPLIELDGIPGIDNEFYMIQRRLAIVADAGGTAPNMYIYRYATSGSGRQLMKTIAAADNNYSYPVNQTNYIQSVWGEAFSIYITGEVDKFELDGMSLFYNVLGKSSVIVDAAS